MHKLHAILKKAGISLLTAFTVFTNTNMGTLVALAAEPHLDEGEELYQITDDENTYTVREYTTDNSEVLFALRPETTYSADDQYEAYADDGVDTYLDDNNVTEDQLAAIRKIISIGYGMEPNAGNYIASQVLIWQVTEDKTYEVDENVAANMEALQARIEAYDTDPGFVGQDITLEGYGEDYAVTLEDASFTGYTEKKIPAGYHVEINDGSLKLWSDEGTEAGTLTFEKKSSEMKSILYKGTNGEFLSLGMEPKEISVNANVVVPQVSDEQTKESEPKEEKAEESEETKPAKKAKAAKAPVNNESVVAESVGDVRLIDISDVHVDYLKADSETMTEGETFQTTSSSLSFSGRLEWKIPNSTDLTNIERVTYQLPQNVELTELFGDVTYKGEVVGTFEIDDGNMLFISYTDDFKKESNRAGWFKFSTESVEVLDKEQNLKFDSGEEFSFKTKEVDPPKPEGPKIGIKKTYHEIKEGDSIYLSDTSSQFDTNRNTHYTVDVYTKDGVNNNVVVEDNYIDVNNNDVAYDAYLGVYRIRITNNGQIKYNQIFMLSSLRASDKADDSNYLLMPNLNTGDYYWNYGNLQSVQYGGTEYLIEAGLKQSERYTALPTVMIDHLNAGDVLTIDYMVNDRGGDTKAYGVMMKNTATVVSDENPEAPGTGNIFADYSPSAPLTQQSEVVTYNNGYNLFDKEAEVEEDTVHTTITINGNKELKRFYGTVAEILSSTYDTTTNFSSNSSLEPSDDADFYLDKNSVEVEVTRLASVNGQYQRQTLWSSKNSGYTYNPSVLHGFLKGWNPVSVLIPYGTQNQMTQDPSVLAPVITIKYDLKLNPNRVKFSSCSKLEIAGSNTLSSSSSLLRDPSNHSINYSKTVNYKNTITPPSVSKFFKGTYPLEDGAEDGEEIMVYNLEVYVPVTGLTNLVVEDLPPSESLIFASDLTNDYYTNGMHFKSDSTTHENPITFSVVTDEETGLSKGQIKIDGRVEAPEGGTIKLELAFYPGDYTKDPNYQPLDVEAGQDERIVYTNDVDIHADEILNPCKKCLTACTDGTCTKVVKAKSVVNKSLYKVVDKTDLPYYVSSGTHTHGDGELVIYWNIDADISSFINEEDEIAFVDTITSQNFKLDTFYYLDIPYDIFYIEVVKDGKTIRYTPLREFFDVSTSDNTITFKVKQPLVKDIIGSHISFKYGTIATQVNAFSSVEYKNHVDLKIKNEKVSESDAKTEITAKKDDIFQKTSMTIEEFHNEYQDSNFWSYVQRGMFTRYHPIDIDNASNKNVVVWKMEVDISKLNIDENTQSITVKDIFPTVPNNVEQEIFGVLVSTGYIGNSTHCFIPIKDGELVSPNSVQGMPLFGCSFDLTNKDLSATITNPETLLYGNPNPYSSLKDMFERFGRNKLYVYLFADYIPKDNNNNQTTSTTITNNAELLVDGVKMSTDKALKEIEIEPSIKKTVIYNKDTAPYAEYSVEMKINENSYDSGNSYSEYEKLIIEDQPSENLDILLESVTFDLNIKSIFDSWEKTCSFAYDEQSGRWKSNQGYYMDKDAVTLKDGKLYIDFPLKSNLTYGTPHFAPGTTFTLKYKAKVDSPEGETLNEKNEISCKTSGKEYKTTSTLSGTAIGNFFSKSAFVLTDIFKKDAKTNTALEGAEFRIDKLTLNAEHTTIIKTETYGTPFTSGTDGHTDTVKLNYDTVYRLVETKTPDGYPTENKVTKYVVFPGHDNIDWSKVSVDGIDYIEVMDPTIIDKDNKVSQATVEVANIKETSRKIVLTKKDDKGRILPNATFSLTGDDGSYTEYKTKSDGTLEISNVVRGVTYTLAEKEAPQFYEVNSNVITFKISDTGEISSSSISAYNVNFDGGKGTVTLDDETGDSVTKEIDSGTAITDMPETTAPEGYHFVRWIDDAGNTVDANTVVDQNMHVTAQYERDTHTVTFRTDEGTMSYREKLNVTEIERIVPDGNKLEALPKVKIDDPTKAVAGWFDEDGNEVTIDTIINKDMVVTAKIDNTVLQTGPEFASNLSSEIKHVVFGRSFDYPDITNSIDGINVDENGSGTIKAYKSEDTLYVLSEGAIYFNPDSSNMFANENCKLEDITFKNIDTSMVTDMHSMFEGQDALQSLDLRNFETSSVVNMEALFKDCTSLSDAKLSYLNTSKVQNFSKMFENCESLKEINLTTFDTSQATDFSNMFAGCTALSELDLSQFNSENVVDMSEMFKDCTNLTDLKISGFDTNCVARMQSMFSGCEKLARLDLSGFNASNLITMESMFNNCTSLESLDISGIDTTNNPIRTNMFTGTTTLRKIKLGANWTATSDTDFNDAKWISNEAKKQGSALMSEYTAEDAGIWRKEEYVSPGSGLNFNSKVKNNATDVEHIIFGERSEYETILNKCSSFSISTDLDGYYDDQSKTVYVLSDKFIKFSADSGSMFKSFGNCKDILFQNINTSSVTSMNQMFMSCNSLVALDLSSFDTSNVTSMYDMFYGCTSLSDLDISNFDTTNVKDMGYMFDGCSSLIDLNLSSFDTTNVTTMSYMFAACRSLENLDLSSFNTQNVTNMTWMFSNCTTLSELNLSNFNTSNVVNMYSMFDGCSSLIDLDVSSFDTSKVTRMDYMFYDCRSLVNLDLSNFNTSKVKDMKYMFYYCNSLRDLDVSNFDTTKVEYMTYMFAYCNKLSALDLSSFNINTSITMHMFDNCTSVTDAYARTQSDVDKLNSSSGKPTTWSFVVKP